MPQLILIGDALHNLLGGLAVAAAFIADLRLGIGAWLVTAAHEVPQELGDFAVLVHGGWSQKAALLYNFLSASIFLLGGIIAYAAAARIEVVPAALCGGNFIYIAASDLVPEVKQHHGWRRNVVHLVALVTGIGVLLVVRVALG